MKHHNSVSFKCNILFHLKSFYFLPTLVNLNREVLNIFPEIGTIILIFIPLIIEKEIISVSPISKIILFILHLKLIQIFGHLFAK